MDNTNPLGIFRDEISSKIDQLVDDININNTSRSQGKLSSLFLRKKTSVRFTI